MKNQNFSESEIQNIWMSTCGNNKICYDPWQRIMHFDQYGSKSEFGWEIDHVFPINRGGDNKISNLQPLHWTSNLLKSNKINCQKWERC